MGASREGDQEPRAAKVEKDFVDDKQAQVGSSDLAAPGVQYEHFSTDDPERAARVVALESETRAFCQRLGVEQTGLREATPAQLRQFQADAQERSRWSQTQKDAFEAILRVGKRPPPRSQRIL